MGCPPMDFYWAWKSSDEDAFQAFGAYSQARNEDHELFELEIVEESGNWDLDRFTDERIEKKLRQVEGFVPDYVFISAKEIGGMFMAPSFKNIIEELYMYKKHADKWIIARRVNEYRPCN
jgi:hypothetical protein